MTTNEDAHRAAGLAHGQLCYLQIPRPGPQPIGQVLRNALWVAARRTSPCGRVFLGGHRSGSGCRAAWHTADVVSGFEAPGLIGQWVEDRAAAPDTGPLAWINVDDIDDTLALAAANGGEVLEPPSLDGGVRWLATIHDPAGNTIGIVQFGPR